MTEARRPPPTLSFVIPVYNEVDVLPHLFARLTEVLETLPEGSDAWLVDDGSTDGSTHLISDQSVADPRFHLVELSRNFGHAAALTAGLDHADGEAVLLLDADLQDPPELVHDMVERYRQGYEVVQARRRRRHGEGPLKRLTAWAYYRALQASSRAEIAKDVGEFALLSRAVVEALRQLREQHRLLRGLVAWVGFPRVVIEYDRQSRAHGSTKFPFRRMVALA